MMFGYAVESIDTRSLKLHPSNVFPSFKYFEMKSIIVLAGQVERMWKKSVEILTASSSLTFFFKSLYFAWYLLSSAPAATPWESFIFGFAGVASNKWFMFTAAVRLRDIHDLRRKQLLKPGTLQIPG
jgi:hypothetical protein